MTIEILIAISVLNTLFVFINIRRISSHTMAFLENPDRAEIKKFVESYVDAKLKEEKEDIDGS